MFYKCLGGKKKRGGRIKVKKIFFSAELLSRRAFSGFLSSAVTNLKEWK